MPPFMATPLTCPAARYPPPKVGAEITGSSAHSGSNAFGCALQVTLPALALDTVFSVDIGGGGFANPSGGDSPQVTAFDGCQGGTAPLAILPWERRLQSLRRQHQRRRVHDRGGDDPKRGGHGRGGATITQPVTVPGPGTGTATFVLPQAAAQAGMAAVDPAGFSG